MVQEESPGHGCWLLQLMDTLSGVQELTDLPLPPLRACLCPLIRPGGLCLVSSCSAPWHDPLDVRDKARCLHPCVPGSFFRPHPRQQHGQWERYMLGAQSPRFKSHLCTYWLCRLGLLPITSLSLSFPTFKWDIILVKSLAMPAPREPHCRPRRAWRGCRKCCHLCPSKVTTL